MNGLGVRFSANKVTVIMDSSQFSAPGYNAVRTYIRESGSWFIAEEKQEEAYRKRH